MSEQTGKYIVIIGTAILLVGGVIYFFHDKLGWIGHLPGDIRIERSNLRFYFPVTTMILFSIALSVIVQLIKRFL